MRRTGFCCARRRLIARVIAPGPIRPNPRNLSSANTIIFRGKVCHIFRSHGTAMREGVLANSNAKSIANTRARVDGTKVSLHSLANMFARCARSGATDASAENESAGMVCERVCVCVTHVRRCVRSI